MTREEAIGLLNTKWWEGMSHRDIVMFQLFVDRLCIPFDIFHEALEKALGRPVWTHELGLNAEGLKKELLGEKEPPTMREIMELIPEEKRIIIIK